METAVAGTHGEPADGKDDADAESPMAVAEDGIVEDGRVDIRA